MFTNIRATGSLSENIVEQIIQKVDEGQLKPGDRLPSERELCDMFGVSRTVIRDALKTLSGLRVLTIRQGMGTFINDKATLEKEQLTSLLRITEGTILEIYQVRKILDPQVSEMATEIATSEDIAEMELLIERSKNAVDNEQLWIDLDTEFHLKLFEITGNRVLSLLAGNIFDVLIDNKVRIQMIQGRHQKSIEDHIAILEAIKERNKEKVNAATRKHLEDAIHSIESIIVSEEEKDME